MSPSDIHFSPVPTAAPSVAAPANLPEDPILASLALLPPALRNAAATLSIFRASFSAEAAEKAANVETHHLLALRDRGLLSERRGRFSFPQAVLRVLSADDDIEGARVRGRAGLVAWFALRLSQSAILFSAHNTAAAVAFLDSEWHILNELWTWFGESGGRALADAVESQLPAFVRATRSAWSLLNLRLPHAPLFRLAEALAKHPWPLPSGMLRHASPEPMRSLDEADDAAIDRMVDFAAAPPTPSVLNEAVAAVTRDEERLEAARRRKDAEPALAGADALSIWGWALGAEGRHEEAVEAHRKALALFEQMDAFGGAQEEWNHLRDERASALFSMGVSLHVLGRSKEALRRHRAAVALRLALYNGERHMDVAESFTAIALAEEAVGFLDDATTHFRRALSIRAELLGVEAPHSELVHAHGDLARSYRMQRLFPLAIEHFRKALEEQMKLLGASHPAVGEAYEELGECHSEAEDATAAIEAFKKALEIAEAGAGGARRRSSSALESVALLTARLRLRLGQEMLQDGQAEESLEYLHEALTARMKAHGDVHVEVLEALQVTGAALKQLARFEEALEFYEQCRTVAAALEGPRSALAAACARDLGRLYDAVGKAEDAAAMYAEADELDRLVRTSSRV